MVKVGKKETNLDIKVVLKLFWEDFLEEVLVIVVVPSSLWIVDFQLHQVSFGDGIKDVKGNLKEVWLKRNVKVVVYLVEEEPGIIRLSVNVWNLQGSIQKVLVKTEPVLSLFDFLRILGGEA